MGRLRVDAEVELLVVQMAKENPAWGYDRIVGALANLGHQLSDQTVGNILRRHHIAPARSDFIRSHLDVLAGTDFFTVEVLTLKGLVTYYVLFFIHLEKPQDLRGRHDAVTGPGVDGAAGTHSDHGTVGIPQRLPVPAA